MNNSRGVNGYKYLHTKQSRPMQSNSCSAIFRPGVLSKGHFEHLKLVWCAPRFRATIQQRMSLSDRPGIKGTLAYVETKPVDGPHL